MNPLNYASLEASKRLVDNGIALETEAHHIKYGTEWELKPRHSFDAVYGIPAPSMAEVWRELPLFSTMDISIDGLSRCWTKNSPTFSDTNPTDALIDLIIWLKKEAADERANR